MSMLKFLGIILFSVTLGGVMAFHRYIFGLSPIYSIGIGICFMFGSLTTDIIIAQAEIEKRLEKLEKKNKNE